MVPVCGVPSAEQALQFPPRLRRSLDTLPEHSEETLTPVHDHSVQRMRFSGNRQLPPRWRVLGSGPPVLPEGLGAVEAHSCFPLVQQGARTGIEGPGGTLTPATGTLSSLRDQPGQDQVPGAVLSPSPEGQPGALCTHLASG